MKKKVHSVDRSALRAETGGVIIADGATISGYDIAAISNTGGKISLNGSTVDQNPHNATTDIVKHRWYQKPAGLVAIPVVSGLILLVFQYLFGG